MKIKVTDIEATGTRGNTTYLRGDGVWEVPPGGGGGGGGAPWWLQPPSAASLTLTNTGGTDLVLTDDADAGLLVDTVNSTGSNQTRRATRALTNPSLDWDLKIRLSLSMANGSDCGFGICLLAATSEQLNFNLRGNENILVLSRTAAGAFNTTYTNISSTENTPVKWLRAQRVGANLFFYVSAEGKLWKQVGSSVAASVIPGGPTRVGFSGEYSATTDWVTTAAVEYFSLTGPAV